MLAGNLGNVFALLLLLVATQVIAIVDFNFDGNPKSDAQICCMADYNFPTQPFIDCYAKLVEDPTQEVDRVILMCVHECYYDAIGMFAGGKVQATKYRGYRDTLPSDLQESFTWAMQFCAAFLAKAVGSTAAVQKLRCNPLPYLFNRCLAEAGVVNCPPSRVMNATLCTSLVDSMKKKYGDKIQLSTARKASGGG